MRKVCGMLVWLALGNAGWGSDLHIAGAVIDEDNRARPDVTVGLMRDDWDDLLEIPAGESPNWDKMIEGRGWWQQTNRDGEFEFTGLHRGKYLLTVMGDPSPGGMEYAVVDIELADGSVSNVSLLPGVIPKHVLRGVLQSSRTGEPVQADVSVTPYELESTPSALAWMLETTRLVQTDPEGGFVKTGLPAGSYLVRLSGLDEAVHGRSEIGVDIRLDATGAVIIGPHYRAYLDEVGLELRFGGADAPDEAQGP